MSFWERTKAVLVRRRKLLIAVGLIYIVLMVLLVVFSSGPQTEPFQYQIR
jgi:hypothetical protein